MTIVAAVAVGVLFIGMLVGLIRTIRIKRQDDFLKNRLGL